MVLSAILAGGGSLLVSLMAGHPPLVALLFYSLAGMCGMLAFALQLLLIEDRSA